MARRRLPLTPLHRCHAHGCNCERFVPRTPIGGWPSCECTHTEHIHREESRR